MLILVLFSVVVCLGGWIHGEVVNNRPVRILSAMATILVVSVIAASVTSLSTSLSVGIPMSSAFHEYLDASRAQLSEGNTQFVIDEFKGFKQRAQATYETGAFRDAVKRETQRMHNGPSR